MPAPRESVYLGTPLAATVLGAVAGYRFLLVLPDGEPADPALFPTVIPTWRVGDEFIAGVELTKFRILAIEPVTDAETGSRDIRRDLDRRAGRTLIGRSGPTAAASRGGSPVLAASQWPQIGPQRK